MFYLFAGYMWAQTTLKVSGTVVSGSDNLPVIGASVVETGKSTNGAATDIDGNFHLNVPEGASVTVSYIGYKSVTMKAEPQMRIVLEENNELLDEVVVTGYSTQRKADLTGSVAVVRTDELKTTADPDPMRALQGKVPGMTITANGSPSGVGTVRIRGIGSFNSSQDPLYIVDGVPTTRALNSLNTNDIESMQVLKDAASASIYGSRASNGVVIITTKQGKKNDKVRVDFSANLTAQFYTKQSKMKLLNSAGYAAAMAQAEPMAIPKSMALMAHGTASGFSAQVAKPQCAQFNPCTCWRVPNKTIASALFIFSASRKKNFSPVSSAIRTISTDRRSMSSSVTMATSTISIPFPFGAVRAATIIR